MEPILELDNLSVTYDTSIQRIKAIDNVSLHVNKGEIIGIIGASGSGTSTLAKTILGLYAKNQFNQGSIIYHNGTNSQDLFEQSIDKLQEFRKTEATIVFQNPLLNLNPSATIKTHFDRLLTADVSKTNVDIITDVLKQVDLGLNIEETLSAYPHQLSGGQQQRVLIALAICQEVDLLLLDEPMSSLDKVTQSGISRILLEVVAKRNMAIILISHDLNIISDLSQRIYVLNEGSIIEYGICDEILLRPQHSYTKELVSARLLENKMINNSEKVPLIRIRNLSHSYRKGGFLAFNKTKVEALKDLNVTINKGLITGLVGPSGSGKSTLVQLILGNEKLQEGAIEWERGTFDNDQIWQRIQIVPQNTTNALNPRILLNDQLKEVYRKTNAATANFDNVIASLLADVGLEDQLRYRYPSELSGGEIQRMAILRALIVRPDVLVLDESLSALDMLVQAKLVDLIKKLNSQLNITIIIISHDDRLVSSCCDTIIQLDKGTILSV